MRIFRPFIKELFEIILSEHLAESFFALVLALYCTFFKFLLQKFCWIYYQNLSIESQDFDLNNLRISILMRFSCCYYVAMNTVVILNMNLDNWGGWILILNYLNFLILSYSNWDIIGDIIRKIKTCFFQKIAQKKTPTRKFIEFQKVFSGCSLDIQLICIMRLLVMSFWRRWSTGPGIPLFYKNCSFEIVDTYEMNFWGLCY